MNKKPSPKLYLLTNEDPLPLLLDKLNIVLQSQVVSLLQIRRKQHQADSDSLCGDIDAICNLASAYRLPIVINDNVSLAKKFVTGVHLGDQDTSLFNARRLLGAEAIIGKSCYQSPAKVDKAITHHASYAAMGAVFASVTKPSAKSVTFLQLQTAATLCQQRGSALCVIGGIDSVNVTQLKGIAIDYVAVTADIMGQPLDRIEQKCQQWQQVLAAW